MKKFYKKICACFAVVLMCGSTVFAQKITGIISDENNDPLPGLSVVIKGTTNGTVTNIDGVYTIDNVTPGDYVLVYSYIGYKKIEKSVKVSAAGNTTVNVKMETDAQLLSEFVFTGYGVQRTKDVSGSISTVKGDVLKSIPVPSFEAALQGQAAGVQVNQGSALAGSGSVIRIRGASSIGAGGDPLYIIDGIPITQDNFLRGKSGAMNNNPLASINANDIEKIEVLKDAASTGIYGARGSNGVILVTTKRASKKGLQMDFRTSLGVASATKQPNMLNTDQLLQLRQEAWENDGGSGYVWLPGFSGKDDSAEGREAAFLKASKINTDWVDLTTQVGFLSDYDLSARYAKEKVSLYGGISYNNSNSYLVGNSYRRTSVRLNSDFKLLKNLTVKLNNSYSYGINTRVEAAWNGGLGAAMSTALPYYPVYNEDGTYFAGGSNPVRSQNSRRWKNFENRYLNGIIVEFSPIKNLFFIAKANSDYMSLSEDRFETIELVEPDSGKTTVNKVWVSNYNTTITGNYIWEINENNNLNVLVGSEFNKAGVRKTDYTYTRTSDLERFNGTENAQFEIVSPAFPDKYAFLSYFSRFNYSFKDKYLVQATLRTDGSSKFGPDNRFGFFPSGSLGWVVSKESWFKVKPISYMKLRTSYGITGNSNLENNAWRAIVARNQNPYGGEDFYFPINIENPDLKWENNYIFDAGLELGFLDDRITTEIAVYRKLSKDVILRLAPPPSYGFTYVYDNLGEIENKGIEFSIKSVNIDKKFRWVTNLNIAHNKNKVLDIGGYSADAIEGGTNDTRVVVGQPLGANFLVRFSHVDPASGRPVYLDIDGKETFTWDPKDRVVVGDIYPDVVGGINNTFSFKNWEVALQTNFSLGAKIYDSSSKQQLGVVSDWNMRTEIFDRWQKPGDIAEYPKLSLNTESYGAGTIYINTDQWLKDADYLRFKLISIGYNLSNDFCRRVKIGSAKIVASATNFATITNFKGLDPEIARDFEDETDRNMSPNITYLTPSQQKTYNLTLSISF